MSYTACRDQNYRHLHCPLSIIHCPLSIIHSLLPSLKNSEIKQKRFDKKNDFIKMSPEDDMESNKKTKNNMNSYSLSFILIGIGVFLLLYPGSFFPWIFLIPTLYYIPQMFIKGSFRESAQSILIFISLFLMFYLRIYLPIMLILAGVLILLSLSFKMRLVVKKD